MFDILIYTETARTYKISQGCAQNDLQQPSCMPNSKCEFHQSKIDYLGYCITHKGIEMDLEKVQAVLEWTPPLTQKQLQSFLGLVNFYHQFIPSFAQVTIPITTTKDRRVRGSPNVASC